MRLRWVERWYLSYALLGAVSSGLIPILVPLGVSTTASAASVGLVMAGFNLGGLSAVLWGPWTDRYRLHRLLLAGGLAALAVALGISWLATTTGAWLALGLVEGTAAAAASTVANLFVVEAHPREEWDQRIGWLQTTYGAGQVAGLLLASGVGFVGFRLGLALSGALAIAGAAVGWSMARTPPAPLAAKPVLLHAVRHGEWPVHSPQRLFHLQGVPSLRGGWSLFRSPYGRFLVGWVLSFGGAAATFAVYPVLMNRAFGLGPGAASLGFALAAAVGLALYTPAGRWSELRGARSVQAAGLAMRVIAFGALMALGLGGGSHGGPAALLGFGVVVLAWSLISVSGTTMVARLAPGAEGQAMGVFSAATALAGVLGAGAGGWIAQVWGYAIVPALGAAGAAAGLAITLTIRAKAVASMASEEAG
jgi:MFS family permease